MPRLVLVLVCVLVAAGTVAPAAAAGAPGDRTAARAIRQATIRLHERIFAQRPAIRAAYRRFREPACMTAIEGVPEDQGFELEQEFLLPVVTEMLFGALRPNFAAFATELEQVPMRDRALRRGRAVWRVLAGIYGRLADPPADLCARLDAWRQAGYPAASRPKISDPAAEELSGNVRRMVRLEAKLSRAGRRAQELGMSERVAGWWSGATLLDSVQPTDVPVAFD